MTSDRFLHFLPLIFLFLLFPVFSLGQVKPNSSEEVGWPTYGDDPGGARYSSAGQVNRTNVTHLQVVWKFQTGALPHDPKDLDRKAAFESTPILVDDKLYLSTPYDHVIALNAETGA